MSASQSPYHQLAKTTVELVRREAFERSGLHQSPAVRRSSTPHSVRHTRASAQREWASKSPQQHAETRPAAAMGSQRAAAEPPNQHIGRVPTYLKTPGAPKSMPSSHKSIAGIKAVPVASKQVRLDNNDILKKRNSRTPPRQYPEKAEAASELVSVGMAASQRIVLESNNDMRREKMRLIDVEKAQVAHILELEAALRSLKRCCAMTVVQSTVRRERTILRTVGYGFVWPSLRLERAAGRDFKGWEDVLRSYAVVGSRTAEYDPEEVDEVLEMVQAQLEGHAAGQRFLAALLCLPRRRGEWQCCDGNAVLSPDESDIIDRSAQKATGTMAFRGASTVEALRELAQTLGMSWATRCFSEREMEIELPHCEVVRLGQGRPDGLIRFVSPTRAFLWQPPLYARVELCRLDVVGRPPHEYAQLGQLDAEGRREVCTSHAEWSEVEKTMIKSAQPPVQKMLRPAVWEDQEALDDVAAKKASAMSPSPNRNGHPEGDTRDSTRHEELGELLGAAWEQSPKFDVDQVSTVYFPLSSGDVAACLHRHRSVYIPSNVFVTFEAPQSTSRGDHHLHHANAPSGISWYARVRLPASLSGPYVCAVPKMTRFSPPGLLRSGVHLTVEGTSETSDSDIAIIHMTAVSDAAAKEVARLSIVEGVDDAHARAVAVAATPELIDVTLGDAEHRVSLADVEVLSVLSSWHPSARVVIGRVADDNVAVSLYERVLCHRRPPRQLASGVVVGFGDIASATFSESLSSDVMALIDQWRSGGYFTVGFEKDLSVPNDLADGTLLALLNAVKNEPLHWTEVHSDHVIVQLMALPHPTKVSFTGRSVDTSPYFLEVAGQFEGLRLLSLEGQPNLLSSSLSALNRCGTTLQTLLLCGNPQLDDDALATVAQHCPALGTLDVSHCTGITPHGVAALASLCHLHTLRARYVGPALLGNSTAASFVSESPLVSALAKCPALCEVDLTANANIVDDVVLQLERIPKLARAIVRMCPGVSSKCVQELALRQIELLL
eukprot:PhM_4_TR18606/c0_g1_i1/m.30926